MKSLALLICIGLQPLWSADFSLLSKDEVKAFAAAAHSIEDAYQERNLSPIATFGPSILGRYSALLLQSDPWAKKQRVEYQRLDSLIAYALVRLRIDSALAAAASRPRPEVNLLRRLDAELPGLNSSSNVCVLDRAYCDSTKASISALLEKQIPLCVKELSDHGQAAAAYQVLAELHLESKDLQAAKKAMETQVEREYRGVLSNSEKAAVLAFQAKYPAYRPEKLKERLGSLEADEMYHLLASGSREEWVQFLTSNPASPYGPDVKKRLEPVLFTAAVESLDPIAERQYLAIFGGESERGRKVAETLAWMFRPATDSAGTPSNLKGEASWAETDPELDKGQDGPRVSPLPEGLFPLANKVIQPNEAEKP